ncbi:hypothetical protein NDU88_005766 [Pleurodeles waltl]|uniref:Uncharacterized protein n=1 Tax=Pleurodeles waltl TaxID=8319 RepID=A0AAV7TDL1_PLEWA|nr:hypothetical protein NDU88_005766 [Pleurodeles waltl]
MPAHPAASAGSSCSSSPPMGHCLSRGPPPGWCPQPGLTAPRSSDAASLRPPLTRAWWAADPHGPGPIPLCTALGSQHRAPLLRGAPQLPGTSINQAPPAFKPPCGVGRAGRDAELS